MELPNKQEFAGFIDRSLFLTHFLDYYEIISHPLCMSKIRERLRRDRYTTIDHFYLEFCQIFKNATTYNQEGSPIWNDAMELKKELEEMLQAAAPTFTPRSLDECESLLREIEGSGKRKHDASEKEKPEKKRVNLTPKAYHCVECGSGFSRPNNLKRHIIQLHGGLSSGSLLVSAGDLERRKAAKESPYPIAAQKVLEQCNGGRPMHYRDITKKALEMGLIKSAGRTPENTMHGQLNKCELFIADGRGYFSLRPGEHSAGDGHAPAALGGDSLVPPGEHTHSDHEVSLMCALLNCSPGNNCRSPLFSHELTRIGCKRR